LVFGSPAHAEITVTDLQVAARALSFVENPLSGAVRVGIVYASGSPRSVQQAEALRDMLGNGLRAGNLELRPVMVESKEAANANVDLFFLTEHVATDGTQLSSASMKKQIPCVTTDVGQVRNGACIMGVRSRPKVEILVNRAAAAASGVTFATVFRVMITEI
jgi:ABC-type uncharacterized transport system substrate-binding protein